MSAPAAVEAPPSTPPEGSAGAPSPVARGWAAEWLAPLVIGAAGLLFGHHPMLLTGLGKTMRDLGDTRFVNYLLEHGYRWILQKPLHESFWDPPFFHPAKGVLAYAESMLGAGPFYWVFRVFGVPPDTSFQLWFFTLSVLNFAAVHLLLRRCFRLTPVASALGAFFFAYANSRINQSMHHQLFPHFYSVLCIYALFRIFEHATPRERPSGCPSSWKLRLGLATPEDARQTLWLALFAVGAVGQLYASFYLGWFLAFSLLLMLLVALALPVGRRRLRTLARTHALPAVVIGLVAGAVILPMGLHYANAAREQGMRSFSEVLSMLPPLKSWLNLGPENWLYRGWQPMLGHIPMEHEQRIGFGVFTTVLFLVGLWWRRRQPAVAVTALFMLVLLFLCTYWARGFLPWRLVYFAFPGAGAIRGVSRIGLQLLLPVSMGIAFVWQGLWERRLGWVAVSLVGFAVLEQFNDGPAFDKQLARDDAQAIVDRLKPRCEAFLFSPVGGNLPYWKYANDAMQASLMANVPTVNGYSGSVPPGWAIGDSNIRSPQDERRIAAALDAWVTSRGLSASSICWVKVPARDGHLATQFISQDVPHQMVAGQRYPVSVTVRNIGWADWTSEERFRLGAQSPQDSRTWGPHRVELPGRVRTGDTVTFRFEVQAPVAPGRYPFQWQMVRDGVAWFGELAPVQEVEVSAP